ncbi:MULTISPECIES: helix-turn-helix transcriptional regulator [Clostridium]|uniref:helix-turn-helix domain-containing protein n=1 Tax=Clostridium TaxID=1485 RepID=UPI0005FB48CF|nr:MULTISPECIES: helix-turn-helix transcriptional regulator [Clostridium]KJZ87242.1 Transcriptional regulator, Cro/CI family [Clostridium sp. IBUN125C]KJZ91281.1 Transcriptional regulator, Cro/CI family [Clostridium sp. IBUN62F]KJZ96300.1 Transcriptional regulator, Cro/CI family [Clostridium sp. IBUN22A]KJZ97324.1 3-hydroxybutyryl-CoA dehydrogenase [Clostridium sp. IBUN13A]MDM8131994.1 helix-turn-helix transcriptional regulator [Clostridium butyricum]
MKERIKKIRTLKGLTQKQFADKIGITDATVSRIESGKNAVTKQVIKSICREFEVNEKWLTDGTGEIFENSENQQIEEIYKENELNSFDKMFIENYIKLNKEERKAVEKFIKGLIK